MIQSKLHENVDWNFFLFQYLIILGLLILFWLVFSPLFLDSLTLAQEVPNVSGSFENNQRFTPPPPPTTSPPPGFGSSLNPSHPPPPPPNPSTRTLVPLEQIEAQLHRQAGIPEKRMLSLAEVEAALLSVNGRPPPSPPPPPMYLPAETVFREQESAAFIEQEAALRKQEALMIQRERKRRDKQRKLAEMVRYNQFVFK